MVDIKDIVAKIIASIISMLMVILTITLIVDMVREQDKSQLEKEIIYVQQVVVVKQLTNESLKECLEQINIKFPHIVYAQARLESGNYESDLFLHTNNLFGMRVPKSRPTTCVGEYNGYAVYKSWEDSVIDYSLYQSYYRSEINNEHEYLDSLTYYAEDKSYRSKIKQISETY